MKNFLTLAYLSVVFLFAGGCGQQPGAENQAVNPVIGDISYVTRYGQHPDSTTDEVLRIQTHLEYVEHQLRNRGVSSYSKGMQQKRACLIDLLHDYWTEGVFPRNFIYPDKRVPCFIDDEGRICAVGYLVEQTMGRNVAEKINSRHKYENLLAMNDKMVDDWIAGSGLTKEECAMIQPTYGYYNPPENISTEYGIASALLGGLSVSLNTINGIQIANGRYNDAAPVMGIFTGGLQIALGAASWPDENGGGGKKTLSMINIGLGTSSLILSTWNLTSSKKRKDRKTTWNVYNYPTSDNSIGIAFCMTRKL